MALDAEVRPVKCWPKSEIRRGAIGASAHQCLGGVNAGLWQKFLLRRQVQRRNKDGASASLAAPDLSRQRERPAQQPPGIRNASFADSAAHRGARDDFAIRDDRSEDLHRESESCSHLLQHNRVARLLVPEAKVVADQNRLGAHLPGQKFAHELLGGASGKGSIEAHHHRRFDAQRGEAVKSLRERAHQRRRLRWTQHLERVRIECNHCGHGLLASRAFHHRAQNFLMPQMHSVKVSDGYDSAA